MTKAEFPWSMKVAVDDIPQTGAHFNLSADERIRTELAGIAGLRALPRPGPYRFSISTSSCSMQISSPSARFGAFQMSVRLPLMVPFLHASSLRMLPSIKC